MSTDVEWSGRLELTKEELWRLILRYSCANCTRKPDLARSCAAYMDCKAGKPLGSRPIHFRARQDWQNADWDSVTVR